MRSSDDKDKWLEFPQTTGFDWLTAIEQCRQLGQNGVSYPASEEYSPGKRIVLADVLMMNSFMASNSDRNGILAGSRSAIKKGRSRRNALRHRLVSQAAGHRHRRRALALALVTGVGISPAALAFTGGAGAVVDGGLAITRPALDSRNTDLLRTDLNQRRARLSLQEAVVMAEREYEGRALAIKRVPGSGGTAYRVRIIKPNGKIKTVLVQGELE